MVGPWLLSACLCDWGFTNGLFFELPVVHWAFEDKTATGLADSGELDICMLVRIDSV